MSDDSLIDVVDRIRNCSRQLVRELRILQGVYLDSGYSYSQCHVLFELSKSGSMSLMELTKKLLVDKSSASRTLKSLVRDGAVQVEQDRYDNRQKQFSLTRSGQESVSKLDKKAKSQVMDALENLGQQQRESVALGLELYISSLQKSRFQAEFEIRTIKRDDNDHVAAIIKEVMNEYKAVGEGYSINDAEVNDIYGNYRGKRCCYYVITRNERVMGGGGIGPLKGGDDDTCELRKMFFLPETRGKGLGRKLLMILLENARKMGFHKCYLETLDRMWQANELYKKTDSNPSTVDLETRDIPVAIVGTCDCYRKALFKLTDKKKAS